MRVSIASSIVAICAALVAATSASASPAQSSTAAEPSAREIIRALNAYKTPQELTSGLVRWGYVTPEQGGELLQAMTARGVKASAELPPADVVDHQIRAGRFRLTILADGTFKTGRGRIVRIASAKGPGDAMASGDAPPDRMFNEIFEALNEKSAMAYLIPEARAASLTDLADEARLAAAGAAYVVIKGTAQLVYLGCAGLSKLGMGLEHLNNLANNAIERGRAVCGPHGEFMIYQGAHDAPLAKEIAKWKKQLDTATSDPSESTIDRMIDPLSTKIGATCQVIGSAWSTFFHTFSIKKGSPGDLVVHPDIVKGVFAPRAPEKCNAQNVEDVTAALRQKGATIAEKIHHLHRHNDYDGGQAYERATKSVH